jgi:hypothetical protein
MLILCYHLMDLIINIWLVYICLDTLLYKIRRLNTYLNESKD